MSDSIREAELLYKNAGRAAYFEYKQRNKALQQAKMTLDRAAKERCNEEYTAVLSAQSARDTAKANWERSRTEQQLEAADLYKDAFVNA